MRRPGADLWWGVIVLLVLILLAAILLVRARSSGGSEQDRGRIVMVPEQRPGATTLDPGHRAVTWTRYSVTGDRLRIEFAGRPCDTGSASLDENLDRVVVTAYLNASDPYQMCVELATGHHTEVRLRSRLGGRPVYDGACLQRSGVLDDQDCRRDRGR